MVDVIANNQELLTMQRVARTANILQKLGLDINTYDLSDTSSENVQLMEDTKAKMSLADIHATACLSTRDNCILNKVSRIPQEANQVIEQQNELASMLGYTAGDGDTASIIAQAKVIQAKSDTFDLSFQDIVGVEPTGFVEEDVGAFTLETSLTYPDIDPCLGKEILLYQGTLQAIGRTIFGNNFCIAKQNAELVAGHVSLIESEQALSRSYANQSLVALNVPAIPINPTQDDVLSELSIWIDAIKKLNAKVGVKESDYAGKKIVDVVNDVAIPNLKVLFGYQNIMNALKHTCHIYMSDTPDSSIPERQVLNNACTSFIDEYAPSNSLKQICTNLYYNDAGTIKTVGAVDTNYAGYPGFMAIICESLNGMKNVETGETISVNYASAIVSPAAWQNFVDNADFFDDVANSDLTWITFV